MRGIILAAGRGSRINEYTKNHPKCLIKFKNKALLDWQIEAMHKAGVNQISIVTGYKKEFLKLKGLKTFENKNWERTNMVSSLFCAREWLIKDKCIVSYSDIFYLSSAIQLLIEDNSDLSITYDPNWLKLWSLRFEKPLIDAETFRLDRNKFLLDIGNKSKTLEGIEGQFMGLLSFTPYSWKLIEDMYEDFSESKRDSIDMTGLLRNLINKNICNIKALAYKDIWGEIDNLSDLIASDKYIKNDND
tara:strand:+ start:419 stop:1156 length:738 start_codon:yes stop_codon:yes gene_type:complete